MIRPLTCLCMLLAGGSGLYLYQEKHRTSLLDREITRTIRASESAHERTGLLRAEWALLNEPGRLQDLADRFLALHAMSPGQFVPAGELASRLPAVAAVPAPTLPEPDAVVADTRPAPAADAAPARSDVARADVARADAARSDIARSEPARPGAQHPEPARVATASAPGEAVHADPVARPVVAPVARTLLAAATGEAKAAPGEAKGAGAATVAHPVHAAAGEARQDRRPEPGGPASSPAQASGAGRSYAASGPGAGVAGYGGTRVMAPVLSALATPVVRPQHAEPLLTRAAATMPVRAAYAPAAPAAPTSYPGSSLGTGRASLPPPVPFGAGAQ